MLNELLLLVPASVFAGFLGALFGIGGGIIIVPMLTLLLNVPIHKAIATSVASVVATSIAGGSAYLEQRIVNFRLGIFLEVATTLGALTGALLALSLSGNFLYLAFGSVALYLTYSLIKAPGAEGRSPSLSRRMGRLDRALDIQGEYFDDAEKRAVSYRVLRAAPGSLISYAAGLASGMLGIGGGVFKVAAMNRYMMVPLKVAIATSKFMIGVTASTSALIYFVSGKLDPFLLAPVALGTITGASLGALVMNKIKGKILKALFIAFALIISAQMLYRGIQMTLGG